MLRVKRHEKGSFGAINERQRPDPSIEHVDEVPQPMGMKGYPRPFASTSIAHVLPMDPMDRSRYPLVQLEGFSQGQLLDSVHGRSGVTLEERTLASTMMSKTGHNKQRSQRRGLMLSYKRPGTISPRFFALYEN